jgi:pseudouridine-5'-phosphate glycosidase
MIAGPHSKLALAPVVAAALAEGRPVVALESTLITHGLPYPANVESALAMEDAVRAAGAHPATIAVLKGRLTVGISHADIESLAVRGAGDLRTCGRRDLPIAAVLGADGATTVAGTMIAARMAGIRVLATGRIGGVRHGDPIAISEDLLELVRTPVAVVCSGGKSLLKMPFTLEVLATHGVPIMRIGTDTRPACRTCGSGSPDARVETSADAARVIAAHQRLGSSHGLLFTVPVLEEPEMPSNAPERAFEQATREAAARGIHGYALMPFRLERVAELIEGWVRPANVALLVNNARVAGEIAASLAALPPPTP